MPAQLGAGQQAQLVDLAQAVPGLKFDLRYAQADNCFGQALTDDQRAFLDADAAQALAQAQQYLKPYGYGILVTVRGRFPNLPMTPCRQIKNPCCPRRRLVSAIIPGAALM